MIELEKVIRCKHDFIDNPCWECISQAYIKQSKLLDRMYLVNDEIYEKVDDRAKDIIRKVEAKHVIKL